MNKKVSSEEISAALSVYDNDSDNESEEEKNELDDKANEEEYKAYDEIENKIMAKYNLLTDDESEEVYDESEEPKNESTDNDKSDDKEDKSNDEDDKSEDKEADNDNEPDESGDEEKNKKDETDEDGNASEDKQEEIDEDDNISEEKKDETNEEEKNKKEETDKEDANVSEEKEEKNKKDETEEDEKDANVSEEKKDKTDKDADVSEEKKDETEEDDKDADVSEEKKDETEEDKKDADVSEEKKDETEEDEKDADVSEEKKDETEEDEKDADVSEEKKNETDEDEKNKKDETDEDNREEVTSNANIKQEPSISSYAKEIFSDVKPVDDPDGPKIEINMIPDNSPPKKKPTKKEIEERKRKIVSDITKQVEELEKTEVEIDYDSYIFNSPKELVYRKFLYDKIRLPPVSQHIRADYFVSSLTVFKEYTSFNRPQLKLMHTIPEKIISLKHLNSVFDFSFVDTSNYHLNDLSKVIQKFFEERNTHLSLVMEYGIITRFIQKLMILLCTNEELPFVGIPNIKPTAQFKYIVDGDFETVNVINPNSRLHKSWIQLVSALFDTTAKMRVFKFKSYNDLNEKFSQAFSSNSDGAYLLEQLIGNTLKTCLWSVSLSYLYAIRSVYIFCRFFSIYFQERRFMGHSRNEIINDLYHMALVSVSLYESQWSIISQCAKAFPMVKGKELSRETKEYLNSHLISSGVYYMLKMFERSVPMLVNQIMQK